VIETSHQELTAKEIWESYMTLSRVEGAFRSLKTDLGVRPVCHQIAERTKAHLLISVLAYHLLVSIEHALRSHNDHRRWSTLREQLSTHQRNTVIFTDADNKIHHLRVSGMPEKERLEIYRLLGVKDPLKRRHQLAGSRL
jgi:transposase